MRLWLALVLAASLAPAQGIAATEYGVKVGACKVQRDLSYTEIGDGLLALEHHRVGLNIGVFVRNYGASPLSLMGEVQYVQKGIDGFTGEHVNCVSLPLLGRYDVEWGSGSVYGAAGPRVDVFLGSGGTHSDDLDNVEFGADAVIGLRVAMALVEGRYTWTPGRDATPGGSDASGEVYQVLVGWTFR